MYEDITSAGFPVWFDQEALLVGQKWKLEIARAIRESSAFIPLISKNSVDKRGHVQNELRQALEVLTDVPSNQIFLMPLRLEEVDPVEPLLEELHWLDLFPDWEGSVARLLEALASVPGLPAASGDAEGQPAEVDAPARAFQSMADVFRLILENLPSSTPSTGAVNGFNVSIRTTETGVALPDHLREKYPREITFVLEHQYRHLVCDADGFSVTLWFSGKETRISAPYDAIVQLAEPDAGIRIA
jgi:hypothetical protein